MHVSFHKQIPCNLTEFHCFFANCCSNKLYIFYSTVSIINPFNDPFLQVKEKKTTTNTSPEGAAWDRLNKTATLASSRREIFHHDPQVVIYLLNVAHERLQPCIKASNNIFCIIITIQPRVPQEGKLFYVMQIILAQTCTDPV